MKCVSFSHYLSPFVRVICCRCANVCFLIAGDLLLLHFVNHKRNETMMTAAARFQLNRLNLFKSHKNWVSWRSRASRMTGHNLAFPLLISELMRFVGAHLFTLHTQFGNDRFPQPLSRTQCTPADTERSHKGSSRSDACWMCLHFQFIVRKR